jgi:hypothetical protein
MALAIDEYGLDRLNRLPYSATGTEKSVATPAKSEGDVDMLVDYRLHPGILTSEDRARSSRDHAAIANHGMRRIFRVGDSRPTTREMERR